MKDISVLLAEDDDDVAATIADVLTDANFAVQRVSDGAAAQRILAKRSNTALLLTDFDMPYVDGAELLAWCRQQGLHFRIVLLSATFELLPQHKRALCDCCAFLLYKPFTTDTLLRVVSAALHRRHAENCSPKRASGTRLEERASHRI